MIKIYIPANTHFHPKGTGCLILIYRIKQDIDCFQSLINYQCVGKYIRNGRDAILLHVSFSISLYVGSGVHKYYND